MLGDPIELEAMLTGDALPPYQALAAYLLCTRRPAFPQVTRLSNLKTTTAFSIATALQTTTCCTRPTLDWLESNAGNTQRRESQAHQRGKPGRGHRKAVVFGPGKYIGQRDLTDMGITFCQLPYEMHQAAR